MFLFPLPSTEEIAATAAGATPTAEQPRAAMTREGKNRCPEHGPEAASHFLHSWFSGCDGLAELRCNTGRKGSNGRPIFASEWFALDNLDRMAVRAMVLSSEGCEVYFGVATRFERRGRKDSVAMLPGPFCDLDFSAFAAGGIEALERLDRFKPQPTAVIHSGAGLHCYWRLKTPMPPTKETRGFIRALVRELCADRAAADLARVLRVPGTWSWKRDAPVRLLRCVCST